MWVINIIEKITPRVSYSQEYILIAIDYFIKWVEAEYHARLSFMSG